MMRRRLLTKTFIRRSPGKSGPTFANIWFDSDNPNYAYTRYSTRAYNVVTHYPYNFDGYFVRANGRIYFVSLYARTVAWSTDGGATWSAEVDFGTDGLTSRGMAEVIYKNGGEQILVSSIVGSERVLIDTTKATPTRSVATAGSNPTSRVYLYRDTANPNQLLGAGEDTADNGRVAVYNGSTWTKMTLENGSGSCNAMLRLKNNQLIVACFHGLGRTWLRRTLGSDIGGGWSGDLDSINPYSYNNASAGSEIRCLCVHPTSGRVSYIRNDPSAYPTIRYSDNHGTTWQTGSLESPIIGMVASRSFWCPISKRFYVMVKGSGSNRYVYESADGSVWTWKSTNPRLGNPILSVTG